MSIVRQIADSDQLGYIASAPIGVFSFATERFSLCPTVPNSRLTRQGR